MYSPLLQQVEQEVLTAAALPALPEAEDLRGQDGRRPSARGARGACRGAANRARARDRRRARDTMQSCCQDNELMPYKHSMQATAKKMHFPSAAKYQHGHVEYQHGHVDVHEHASAYDDCAPPLLISQLSVLLEASGNGASASRQSSYSWLVVAFSRSFVVRRVSDVASTYSTSNFRLAR